MEYHRQTMSGTELGNVIDLPLSLRNKKVEVIILAVEDSIEEYKPAAKKKTKRPLGFVNVPPLPDSFFDPLPEEELQLWGL